MSLENIKKFLDKIAPLAGLNEDELKLLETPENVLEANLEVNGKTYPAYRVQWNSARGPYKGGIRFHPEVDKDEVSSLAFWMSIKTAIADIPLGGGKGGVTCNPKEMSPAEIEAVSRKFVQAFYEHLGSGKDIPAPDVYTNSQIMGFMLDEYEKLIGKKDPGMITGKALDNGGSLVRDIATALGGVYVLEEAMTKLNLTDKKVAIQGFGNAGMTMAELLYAKGFKIVAVSDSRGGVYSPDGLDVNELVKVKNETKSVSNFNAKKVTNEELLELDVDILVPAALDEVITIDNANNIKAKVIVELANGPTTPKADEILHGKDILVLPDVLANAGGVTVSCFEWQQNNANEKWEADDIKSKLKEKMVSAFGKIWQLHESNSEDFRTNAYVLAVKKIIDAERARGKLPSKEGIVVEA
jgi:glutamate dehydrogenase/leucine dehydrogenase